MAQPERLTLWDRFFNRRRREIMEEIEETWYQTYEGKKLQGSEYIRKKVKYKVIDRVTGSETIEYRYV